MIACPAGGGRTVRWARWPETPAGTGASAGTARGLLTAPAPLGDPEVVAGPPQQPTRGRPAAAGGAAGAGAAGPRAGPPGAGGRRRGVNGPRAPPGPAR